jgi:drug/metabolite transporter (DMT)-like permease
VGRFSWVGAYAALALVWGWSFAFNQMALASFSPLQITFGRTLLGAATLVAALLLSRPTTRPSGAELRHLVILGAVGLALPFTLIAFAQTQITSVLAGLLNAATPLFAGIFIALMIPAERPDRGQVLGLILGFLGIAVLIGAWDLGGFTSPTGVAAMLTASVCYGFGTSFSRVSLSSSALTTGQLGAIQLLAAAGFAAMLFPVDPASDPGPMTGSAATAIALLGVAGTGVAMVLFWHIIRRAGSTIAATVTYVIPVVSTTVGVTALGEALLWREVAGGMIIVTGVVLTQWSQLTARRDFGLGG